MAPPLAALALSAASPVAAQSDAASASARANQREVERGDAIAPAHAGGDWGGFRTTLKDRGVDLQVGYLAELADVASGGLRHGMDYAHQIKVQADLDGKPLLGVDGLSFHTALINREGRNASADYLGDDLFQVQEIYGATGNADLHLSYLYGEYGFVNGAVDVKAGRLSVGADFASSPLYCQFLSLGLCPQPRALSLTGTFSVVPSATWATRARLQPGAAYLEAGIYQARPRYGGPSGFDVGFSHTTGMVLPVEIGWEPRFGQVQLQTHLKAGIALDTSNYPSLQRAAPRHGSRLSWYLLADQMLVRTGKDGTDGLILLGGWSHADRDTSVLRDFAFGGLVARGMIAKRPGDVFELLAGHGSVSHALTERQQVAASLGDDLPAGFPPAPESFAGPAAAPGVQTSETFVEANYGFKLHDGVTLTTDVQYVVRPGAADRVPDALVLAGRVEFNL